jgi:hypothetical protein
MGSERGGWVPGRVFVVAFTVANLAGAATTPPRPPRPRSLTHATSIFFLDLPTKAGIFCLDSL